MSLPAIPDRPPEAGRGPAGEVARAVAEDLEAIFPTGPAAAPGGGRLHLTERARNGPTVRREAAASLGALVAAACVGLSAGAVLAHHGAPTGSLSAAAPRAPPVVLANSSLPSPGPLPQTAPMAPPPAAPGVHTESGAPSEVHAGLRRASAQRAQPHRKTARQSATRCRGVARCGGSAVAAADARLGRAYASAERAGVPQPVLTGYRNEWRYLRGRAPHDPNLVTVRYRQMAGDLERLSQHERIAPTGPLERFRLQLATLWR
jgi:hypothetical protein